jgi:hypothetical protein
MTLVCKYAISAPCSYEPTAMQMNIYFKYLHEDKSVCNYKTNLKWINGRGYTDIIVCHRSSKKTDEPILETYKVMRMGHVLLWKVLNHLKFKTMFRSTKMYRQIMADFIREERMRPNEIKGHLKLLKGQNFVIEKTHFWIK